MEFFPLVNGSRLVCPYSLLSAFSILFPLLFVLHTLPVSKKNGLIQHWLLKKSFLSLFLPFSFIFSLKSMDFWISWLSYFMPSCVGECPSAAQPTLKMLSTTF